MRIRQYVRSQCTALVVALMAASVFIGIVPTHAAESSQATVTVQSVSPTVITGKGSVTVLVEVTAGSESIDNPSVILSLSHGQITTRSELQTWQPMTASNLLLAPLATNDGVSSIAAGQSTIVTLSVDADVVEDAMKVNGVYGASVTVMSGGNSVATVHTFIIRDVKEKDAPDPSLSMTVVVPFTTTAMDPATGKVDEDTLNGLVQDTGLFRTYIQAFKGSLFTWVIDPLVVQSAVASPNEQVKDWATAFQLNVGAQNLHTLWYADPDIAALVHNNRTDLLKQSTDALAASPYKTTPVLAWTADGLLDQSTAKVIKDLRAESVIVSGAAVPALTTMNYTPTGRATIQVGATTRNEMVFPAPTATPQSTQSTDVTVSDLDVDVADDDLSSILSSMTEDNAAESIQYLLAQTNVIAAERPNQERSILMTLPRTWDAPTESVQALGTALSKASWMKGKSLTALTRTESPDVARNTLPISSVADDEVTANTLQRADDEFGSLRSFSVIGTDPDKITQPFSQGTLILASSSLRLKPLVRNTTSSNYGQAIDKYMSSVAVVPGSNLNVLSGSPQIPVVVRNQLDQDVRVKVDLSSFPVKFSPASSSVVTVAPKSEKQVKVSVEVIANGNATVNASISREDDVRIGHVASFPASMHADWEGVLSIAILGSLSVIVIVGLVRTFQRGHRRDGTVSPSKASDE